MTQLNNKLISSGSVASPLLPFTHECMAWRVRGGEQNVILYDILRKVSDDWYWDFSLPL